MSFSRITGKIFTGRGTGLGQTLNLGIFEIFEQNVKLSGFTGQNLPKSEVGPPPTPSYAQTTPLTTPLILAICPEYDMYIQSNDIVSFQSVSRLKGVVYYTYRL